MMDARAQQLSDWLQQQLKTDIKLTPVVGDASFRRYFRFDHHDQSFVAMDSPPKTEDCHPFVAIAKTFLQLGLRVPEIFYADMEKGFLLITDFGDKLYHYELNKNNVASLYKIAITELHKIQGCQSIEHYDLPKFDWQFMLTELNNFTEWFLLKFLNLSLNTTQEKLVNKAYETLLESATSQPQICAHRDYHSRNLMRLPEDQIGILDFQDAVIGPVTYDLVSLLRDCYIDWPTDQVKNWVLDFHEQLNDRQLIPRVNEETFLKWFDLMGMQRHLKASFIFARKQLRDQNDFYLQFLPRALNYIQQASKNYRELSDFNHFFTDEVIPAFEQRMKQP